MDGLWRLRDTGLAGFVKQLGQEILGTASQGRGQLTVGQIERDVPDQSYSLFWTYGGKFNGEVMICREGYDSPRLRIDRFLGVTTVLPSTSHFSPEELRAAANIDDNITGIMKRKFGSSVSEHHGREIYQASLQEDLAVAG
ncbi:MAG: hypothetical protein NT076_01970 [Candidatus Pacearchaeota archaeon]|nr:hypothetical protein [Candidatus Pacearchaeota archaeon]